MKYTLNGFIRIPLKTINDPVLKAHKFKVELSEFNSVFGSLFYN
jgi:hypothetical protein